MKHIKLYERFGPPKGPWKLIKVTHWEGTKMASVNAHSLTLKFDDPKPELDKFIKAFALKQGEGFHGEKVQTKMFDDDNEMTVQRDGDDLIITVIGDNAKKRVEDFLKK
jgi:hypothetical protein